MQVLTLCREAIKGVHVPDGVSYSSDAFCKQGLIVDLMLASLAALHPFRPEERPCTGVGLTLRPIHLHRWALTSLLSHLY